MELLNSSNLLSTCVFSVAHIRNLTITITVAGIISAGVSLVAWSPLHIARGFCFFFLLFDLYELFDSTQGFYFKWLYVYYATHAQIMATAQRLILLILQAYISATLRSVCTCLLVLLLQAVKLSLARTMR